MRTTAARDDSVRLLRHSKRDAASPVAVVARSCAPPAAASCRGLMRKAEMRSRSEGGRQEMWPVPGGGHELGFARRSPVQRRPAGNGCLCGFCGGRGGGAKSRARRGAPRQGFKGFVGVGRRQRRRRWCWTWKISAAPSIWFLFVWAFISCPGAPARTRGDQERVADRSQLLLAAYYYLLFFPFTTSPPYNIGY